jgi:hypothetical protein
MNPTLIRPIVRMRNPSRPDWIFAHIPPFFGVTFRGAQAMMKSAALKFSRFGTSFGQLILPKGNPTFDGDEFMAFGRAFGREDLPVVRASDARQRVPTIRRSDAPRVPTHDELSAWRAEQMQVIGHQKIVADEPGGGMMQPDVMQRPLNGNLCQPAGATLSANREKSPVRSAQRNANAPGGCTALGKNIVRHVRKIIFTRNKTQARSSVGLLVGTTCWSSTIRTRGSASLPSQEKAAGNH